LPAVDPLTAPVLFALQQAREDLEKYTSGLSMDQIWAASLGFHLRHIARSTDRLLTYAEGRQLSAEQMQALEDEKNPGATREQLLAEINSSFDRVEVFIRGLDRDRLLEAREVGRKRLPTTVIGLLIHIAEHTQRHVGQAISASKPAGEQDLRETAG
jgi:uncharacterized damage-inducible protein DinB